MVCLVYLKVGVGVSQIRGKQLLRLQVGDVLVLDTDVEELLPCTVAGVVKYWGIPGIVKSNKAFQVIRSEDPQYT